MTKTFTTFLICILTGAFTSVFGQTKINDFEAGSPALVARYGATVSVVSNPNTSGNITANCAKIARTTAAWYELIAFPTSFTVPANTTKYLHVLVNYPAQPDLAVRFDAANENADGSADIRALNTYTNFNKWQDMVFKIEGGVGGKTVNAIIFLPDVGYNNVPVGQVLSSTTFGYVDEFTFSDSSTPSLAVNKNIASRNDVELYPNPAESFFKVTTNYNNKIADISIYSIIGNVVVKNVTKVNANEYDVSNLSAGSYIVKITDIEGRTTSKKMIKK